MAVIGLGVAGIVVLRDISTTDLFSSGSLTGEKECLIKYP